MIPRSCIYVSELLQDGAITSSLLVIIIAINTSKLGREKEL